MVDSKPDASTSSSPLVPLEHFQLFERQIAHANINSMIESPPSISREGFEQILAMLTSRDISPTVAHALDLAEAVHTNQKRRDGSSYYPRHILPVALLYSSVEVIQGRSPSDESIVTALLHDVFEDGVDISLDSIGRTFGEKVEDNIRILSKPKKEYGETSIDRHRKYVVQLEEGMTLKDTALLNIKCIDNFLNMSDDLALLKDGLASPLQVQNRVIQVSKYHEKSKMYDDVLRYADTYFYNLWRSMHIQVDHRLQDYWNLRISTSIAHV